MSLNNAVFKNLNDKLKFQPFPTPPSILAMPSGLWTPANIDTATWFDAADTDTIAESGGSVSQWDDKSTNLRHVSQASGSNQPETESVLINDLNTIQFNGLAYMQSLGNADWLNGKKYSIFSVVATDTTSPNANHFIGCDGGGGNQGLHCGWEASDTWILGHLFDDATFSVTTTTDPIITVSEYKQSGSEVWFNGTSIGTNAIPTNDLTSSTPLNVGAGWLTSTRWEGPIAEIVIVLDSVSEMVRQQIEGYLAWKWGLEDNLPIGHPYKSGAPTI